MSVLEAGTPAPSFRLVQGDGEDFTQENLQGVTTVLVFYPFAFSNVCTDQFQHYDPLVAELAARGGVDATASPATRRSRRAPSWRSSA